MGVSDFLDMASTSITVEPLSTMTAYGAPQFSTTPVTYTAAVEYGPRRIINAQGVQEIARATVYVLSSSASIGTHDRVTLPNDTSARLLAVDVVNDENGQHHLELSFG